MDNGWSRLLKEKVSAVSVDHRRAGRWSVHLLPEAASRYRADHRLDRRRGAAGFDPDQMQTPKMLTRQWTLLFSQRMIALRSAVLSQKQVVVEWMPAPLFCTTTQFTVEQEQEQEQEEGGPWEQVVSGSARSQTGSGRRADHRGEGWSPRWSPWLTDVLALSVLLGEPVEQLAGDGLRPVGHLVRMELVDADHRVDHIFGALLQVRVQKRQRLAGSERSGQIRIGRKPISQSVSSRDKNLIPIRTWPGRSPDPFRTRS